MQLVRVAVGLKVLSFLTAKLLKSIDIYKLFKLNMY